MYYSDGNLVVDGPDATAGIWATYPSKFLSQGNGFGDQVFGTFLLLLCVRGITDERNSNVRILTLRNDFYTVEISPDLSFRICYLQLFAFPTIFSSERNL